MSEQQEENFLSRENNNLNRNSRVQGGRGRRIILNRPNDTNVIDQPPSPEPPQDFRFIDDPDENERRESENPISARFYGRGDLTNEQFESLGFHRLPPGAEVVDHINQATNVEHILPDGRRHFIPAARLKVDPLNPDNLISAQSFSDEEPVEGSEEEKAKAETNQRSRSVLTRSGIYRLVYYPGHDTNSKVGGEFKYYLKEEVPFSLSYYGIYKKNLKKKN